MAAEGRLLCLCETRCKHAKQTKQFCSLLSDPTLIHDVGTIQTRSMRLVTNEAIDGNVTNMTDSLQLVRMPSSLSKAGVRRGDKAPRRRGNLNEADTNHIRPQLGSPSDGIKCGSRINKTSVTILRSIAAFRKSQTFHGIGSDPIDDRRTDNPRHADSAKLLHNRE